MTKRFPRVPSKFRMEVSDHKAPAGEPLVAHEKPILALAYSSDGRSLAASGGGLIPGASTVQVIDVERRAVRRICHGHVMGVFDLAFDPLTGLLASASHDYSVLLWEVDERNDAIYLVGDPHAGVSRHRVAFAGSSILIGDGETFRGEEGTLSAIDLGDGTSRTLLPFDHRQGAAALCVLPGGDRLVVLVDEMRDSRMAPEVRVVGLDGAEHARWCGASAIREVAPVNSSEMVAIASKESDDDEVVELALLDVLTGERRAARPLPGGRFGALAASPLGDAVAVAYEQVVEVHAADDLTPIWRVDLGKDDGLSVAWSPNGDEIAIGTLAHTVRFFATATGKERLD